MRSPGEEFFFHRYCARYVPQIVRKKKKSEIPKSLVFGKVEEL